MRNRTGQRQSRGDRRVGVAAVSRWRGSKSNAEGRAGMLGAKAVQEEGANKEEVLQGKSVPGAVVSGIGTLLRERLLSRHKGQRFRSKEKQKGTKRTATGTQTGQYSNRPGRA